MPDIHVIRNAAATERLRALADGLTAADLGRSLGGGWTVAIALAHLAFWDGRQRGALEHFAATGELLGEESDDAVNVGLEPLAQVVDAASAARLALQAAEAVDVAIAALSPEAATTIVDSGSAYQVQRYGHREEHAAQIEACLRA